MRPSIRTAISSDDGATRWLAGAAGGALLIAALATLPALADEPAPPAPPTSPAAVTQVDTDEDAEFEGVIGEPLEDEVTDEVEQLGDAEAGYEGVIGEPLEDEVTDEG